MKNIGYKFNTKKNNFQRPSICYRYQSYLFSQVRNSCISYPTSNKCMISVLLKFLTFYGLEISSSHRLLLTTSYSLVVFFIYWPMISTFSFRRSQWAYVLTYFLQQVIHKKLSLDLLCSECATIIIYLLYGPCILSYASINFARTIKLSQSRAVTIYTDINIYLT